VSEEDSGNGEDSRARRISRQFAKTLHDFSLRLVQRAGRYLIKDEFGTPIYYFNALALDRTRRYVRQTCDALYDVFEQKVSWMGRVLHVVCDAGGEWELRLPLPKGGYAVIALGNIERGELEIAGQDMPAFQVPNLDQLIRRTERQIRLRQEYRRHLS